MLPAALDDEATRHGAGRTASISPARGQYGNQAGAAAEATPTQEEPGRLPAQERRTWFFRGMIALLGVLIAGRLEGRARPGAGYADPGEGEEVSVVAHRAGVLGDLQRAGHHRRLRQGPSPDFRF
jgi:hypothetical protein